MLLPSKVRADHLNRKAIVYIRQSTLAQVRFNRESTERQYVNIKENICYREERNASVSIYLSHY